MTDLTLPQQQLLLVDQYGFPLYDPTINRYVGGPPLFRFDPNAEQQVRMVHALPTNVVGGKSQRYRPTHPKNESCVFGINFENVIPNGVSINAIDLFIYTNTVPPVEASGDWIIGIPNKGIEVQGRRAYVTLGGGVHGTDYDFQWQATDANGNVYFRSALVLVDATS